jgi:hypothetical protein
LVTYIKVMPLKCPFLFSTEDKCWSISEMSIFSHQLMFLDWTSWLKKNQTCELPIILRKKKSRVKQSTGELDWINTRRTAPSHSTQQQQPFGLRHWHVPKLNSFEADITPPDNDTKTEAYHVTHHQWHWCFFRNWIKRTPPLHSVGNVCSPKQCPYKIERYSDCHHATRQQVY